VQCRKIPYTWRRRSGVRLLLLVTAVLGAPFATAGTVAVQPNLTLSFDAEPAYSEFGLGLQTGYQCSDGVPTSTPNHNASQVFVRDPVTKRHGEYSAHVFIFSGDHAPASCIVDTVRAYDVTGEREGDEAWYGWSWRFPRSYPGTNSWGLIMSWTVNGSEYPGYGQFAFDAADPNRLQLRLKTGHTPGPGSSSFNPIPPNGYDVAETILGTGGPRPFTKDVWHDFIMHVIWKARTNGVLELWHREGAGAWEKIYSDLNDGSALINRAPHPTMMYNDQNGAPGDNGTDPIRQWQGFYRAAEGTTVDYWVDGFRRRQSRSALLEEFPPSPH
jgi:hypothetical protein